MSEELPPLATPQGGATGVRILTRMGIPVFLQPASVMQKGHIERIAVHSSKLSFRVKNSGSIHFVEQAVRVRGFGPAGDSLFEHQVAGWYVLAGGSRTHELELPKEACAKIRALAVEVHTKGETFRERFDVPPGA
jgi:fimbrial chaperone protein